MARRTPEPVQMYRGTTALHSTYIGPAGELTVDVDKDTVVVHDGSTPGGHPLAKAATTITASNGVQIASGGTLGQNTAISGVDASTTAKGVVQLESTVTGTAGIVPDSAAVKAYADSAGAPYTATAPIEIDATNRVISADDATTTAKGVVQVGANIDVASGIISVKDGSITDKGVLKVGANLSVSSGEVSVKPYTDYVADHTTVTVGDYQDGAIIQTDEPLNASTLAVIAEVENTLSGSANKVPTSNAVNQAKADVDLGNVTSAGNVRMAHAAMPSGQYEALTLPASGGTVTAPADGWIAFSGTASVGGQFVTLGLANSGIFSQVQSPTTSAILEIYIPTKKDDAIFIAYTVPTINRFRFIYANGSATA